MNRKKYKFRQSYRNHHRQHLEHKAIPASTCIILIRLQEGPLIRVRQKFGIKIYWRLQFLEYLRTLSLKFQKARTKIEVVLSLPSWLSQLNWDSYQGRLRTTPILVQAFWNLKLKVLKYSRNCGLNNTWIPWSLKNPELPNVSITYFRFTQSICRKIVGHCKKYSICPKFKVP